MEKSVIAVTAVCLGALMAALLVRAVKGPRFTDRIVAVNAINTMAIAVICLLSIYLSADYLLDVALIYALLGLVANTLLMRTLIAKRKKEGRKTWRGQ